MAASGDKGKMIFRNMLLGGWVAEKLGMSGSTADDYAEALAKAALDPASNDVFLKIRSDFDAAGVTQSDEQIRSVMDEFTIKAGDLMTGQGGGATADAAEMALKRSLLSR